MFFLKKFVFIPLDFIPLDLRNIFGYLKSLENSKTNNIIIYYNLYFTLFIFEVEFYFWLF